MFSCRVGANKSMNGRSGKFLIGAAVPANGLEDGAFAAHLARVCLLGHSAALATLPWSQIEPEAGRFDAAVTVRCSGALKSLRDANIEPVCVLWDGIAPQWFEARGGWAQAKAAERFSAYAAHVTEILSPHCQWWMPLFEPEYRLTQAFHEKGLSGYRRASVQMLRAHNDTATTLRAVRPDAKVGLSVRVFSAEPADTDSPWDFRAARWLETRLNHRMADRLRHAAGPDAFDFALASWGGVVSAWFSPWRWRREWALTMDKYRNRISLRDAERNVARFDEAMSTLLGYQTALLVVGEESYSTALGKQLNAVASRCAEEGGERIIGFLSRAAIDRAAWESNRPLLEILRAGAEPWPRDMDE